MKIFFFINQLISPNIYTGGEIRGKTMAEFFNRSKKYQTRVVIPKVTSKNFLKFKKVVVGNTFFETMLKKPVSINALILYVIRTLETCLKIKKFKNSILYATGDFFCDTVPCFIAKILYPQTIWVNVIHHVNVSPLKRRSNFFLSNTISYILQRFSFILIKYRSDLIFVVNPQVKQYLIKHGFNNTIVESGNGLNISEIKKSVKNLKTTKIAKKICYFGRVSPTKGSLDLPEIFSYFLKQHPGYHLDIIGKTEPFFKDLLIKKFQKFKCYQHVTIHDFIEDKTKIYQILSESQAIVFPSYEEGWGISLFESIMCYKPATAYALPVFKHLFKGQLLLAPIGNKIKLARNLAMLVDPSNKHQTKKYLDTTYQIAQQYSWKQVFTIEKQAIQKQI